MHNKIKEKLNEKNLKCNIISIFKTGSQLFRSNPHDIDYIVIVDEALFDEEHFVWEEDNKKYDIFIRNTDYVKESLKFDLSAPSEEMWKKWLYNYFYALPREQAYGKETFNWPILQYKEQYMIYMQAQYKTSIGRRQNRTTNTKGWVHYYVVLKIYDNNNPNITKQMKEDIDKLYNSAEDVELIIEWIESKLYEEVI